MSKLLSRCSYYIKEYPMLKGVISYAVIWPFGSIIQQTMSGRRWYNYDYMQCLRYSLYGAVFVAPTLYGWVRLSTFMWPKSNLRTGIAKALVEQVSYGPAAMCCFFFFMSLLEGGSFSDATNEVHDKFFPTWKVGVCFWPIFQTINFAFIKERNRVPIISLGSLGWTTFLAYMKQLELDKLNKLKEEKIHKEITHLTS